MDEAKNEAAPTRGEVGEGPVDAVQPAPQTGKPASKSSESALPPATFTFLITTLATQAMVSLGDIPNPVNGERDARPAQAKHFIDTLQMLEEKTQGNRTPQESAMLSSMLHQLRMAYISAQQAAASTTA